MISAPTGWFPAKVDKPVLTEQIREKITKIFCKARILLNKKSVFFKNRLTNDSEQCMLCIESVHRSLSCGKEDAHGAG